MSDYDSIDQMNPIQAIQIASSLAYTTRAAHHARKHVAIHKIRRCEVELSAAKDKVLEHEKTILGLQKEVDEVDNHLEIIETGLVELELSLHRAEHNGTQASFQDSTAVESASQHSGAG